MKAIVPAAGQGTRLYPQTHTTPKPMIRVAGKPILGHIIDSLIEADLTEIVVVVGSMKDQVIAYVEEQYGDTVDVSFVEQESADGLGHAIYQAASVSYGESLFVVLGDMLFESGYREFLDAHHRFDDVDGSIGVKRVDEPQHYGIVTGNDDGFVTKLEEKPDEPDSDLAISGAYVIEDSVALFEELEYLVENDVRGSGGEFQLTDALERMVRSGSVFRTFEVGEWYDCGRPETLLQANRALLEDVRDDKAPTDDSVLIPPVDIGEDVTLEHSVVGPYVSIDDGASISHSILSDAIVGSRSELLGVNLEESIVGAGTAIDGHPKRLNIGDSSSIDL